MGYVGTCQPAEKVVLDGLKTLEYRGYDSAGIALEDSGKIKLFKTAGRVEKLASEISEVFQRQASGTLVGQLTAKCAKKRAPAFVV